jgi:hypothetical protein
VLVPMATVALALYVVGIPILFAVLLFLHRKDIDKPQVNQWCVPFAWFAFQQGSTNRDE